MLLDLHAHSVSSDDSRATAEQYARWVGVLRRKDYRVDGFVLTEHRKFDLDRDYSAIAREHGLVILKGSEVDTDCGHFLVYGITPGMTRHIDLGHVGMDAVRLMSVAEEHGAIAIPAHPGRLGIGLCEFLEGRADLGAVRIVELLNGGNRPAEQKRAEELAQKYGFLGTGGSDAHLPSAIATCLTEFQGSIATEQDLVRELKAGRFRALRLEQTAALPA